MTKKYLKVEDILSVVGTEVKEVEVKQWGGVVRVKELNGKERDTFEAAVSKRTKANADFSGMKILLLKMALVDEDGAPLFSEANIQQLNEKGGNVIASLFETACQLNGIGEKGEETASKN